ncbi:class I SAM-dependent methyltransferase [Stutzerimonas urumqiensis]|uniref:class I SAM-dependent methyltransferase n=1 Tax=Stutzerimonas urumqiensis TaxID=638269 RepID=UPI001FEC4DC5|nr:protein N-lysine methyltransferase family protein [Stutzerimonas urumqiensis]
MPGYRVKRQTVSVGDMHFVMHSLLDPDQYHDPDGAALALGIDEDSWALFGQVWPSGMVLANALLGLDLHGKRVLELGAGLALASLVAHRRGADVTVSDYHPLIPIFLADNARLNELTPPRYRALDWEDCPDDFGRFDLIIGSDLLYHAEHPMALANVIDLLSADQVDVLLVDPDRGLSPSFCQEMIALEYNAHVEDAGCVLANGEAYVGSLLRFRRDDDALPVAHGRPYELPIHA